MNQKRSVAIVGGGPAGLRAAEVAAAGGASVTLYDAKRSVGRKFLVAGKSGLNLTNSAAFEEFVGRYSGGDFPRERWRRYYKQFDNYHLSEWASGLGIDCFEASGGKVFPFSKKAAPLLRPWVARLREFGVAFQVKHEWVGVQKLGVKMEVQFLVEGQPVSYTHDTVVLAMGGGSWPQTGSTGGWVSSLTDLGVEVVPLRSANCGWECEWTEATRAVTEGNPLQNLRVSANGQTVTGELVVTRYGFEGTPVYTLGPILRSMREPAIEIDFKPTFTREKLIAKMESARRNFYREASLRWKLNETACAILRQFYGEPDDADALATAAKRCRIPLTRPRPIEEAISSAGGVAWKELNEHLMLKRLPGVFCAGEMIDWEAPTGGYLMQGCFVTGTVAGAAAAQEESSH